MELDGCLINQRNEPQPADMTNIDLQLDPGSAGHNISPTDQVKALEAPETPTANSINKIQPNSGNREGKSTIR